MKRFTLGTTWVAAGLAIALALTVGAYRLGLANARTPAARAGVAGAPRVAEGGLKGTRHRAVNRHVPAVAGPTARAQRASNADRFAPGRTARGSSGEADLGHGATDEHGDASGSPGSGSPNPRCGSGDGSDGKGSAHGPSEGEGSGSSGHGPDGGEGSGSGSDSSGPGSGDDDGCL